MNGAAATAGWLPLDIAANPSRPARHGEARCTRWVGNGGAPLRCRLLDRHDAVRYGGDPVHEAVGAAGLLVRWRCFDEWNPDTHRPDTFGEILEVVATAGHTPLAAYGPTSYRPPRHPGPRPARPYEPLRLPLWPL